MQTSEGLVQALEARTLPKSAFTHAAHVQAAWWYLRTQPLGAAMDRFRSTLRAYAESLGASAKYHETMTVAWLLLIEERLGGDARTLDWPAFAGRCPELFDRHLLAQYYDAGTLASDRARCSFVMPARRLPVPADATPSA